MTTPKTPPLGGQINWHSAQLAARFARCWRGRTLCRGFDTAAIRSVETVGFFRPNISATFASRTPETLGARFRLKLGERYTPRVRTPHAHVRTPVRLRCGNNSRLCRYHNQALIGCGSASGRVRFGFIPVEQGGADTQCWRAQSCPPANGDSTDEEADLNAFNRADQNQLSAQAFLSSRDAEGRSP